MKNKEVIHVLLELIPLFKEEYRREALEQAIRIIARNEEKQMNDKDLIKILTKIAIQYDGESKESKAIGKVIEILRSDE